MSHADTTGRAGSVQAKIKKAAAPTAKPKKIQSAGKTPDVPKAVTLNQGPWNVGDEHEHSKPLMGQPMLMASLAILMLVVFALGPK